MKKTNITYWILNVLFAGFMGMSAVPDVLMSPSAVAGITGMGYPLYFIPFIGVAKILGAIVILVPGHNKLKEWAYAGLIFDLIAAVYSLFAVKISFVMVLPVIAILVIGFLAYVWHHKKLNQVI